MIFGDILEELGLSLHLKFSTVHSRGKQKEAEVICGSSVLVQSFTWESLLVLCCLLLATLIRFYAVTLRRLVWMSRLSFGSLEFGRRAATVLELAPFGVPCWIWRFR